jgi:hypothetical protein
MNNLKRYLLPGVPALLLLAVAACSPAVGSKHWCDNMNAKSKADWTANEAVDYAKHCILK